MCCLPREHLDCLSVSEGKAPGFCLYLSARTSRGLAPRDQLRTIQAESIAARKPRAIPVPIGQKG